jgi:H+-translocating NAD(P) transhydrogenase subunit beta
VTGTVTQIGVQLAYLFSAILFIFGLKRLGKVRTARSGNTMAALAMLIAVVATLIEMGLVDYRWIIAGFAVGGLIGVVAAIKVPMTSMPEMVAVFNGFGGGASALVALSVVWLNVVELGKQGTLSSVMGVEGANGPAVATTVAASILIGGVTLSGSVVAYLKLSERIGGRPVLLPARHVINSLLLIGALGFGAHLGFFGAEPAAIEMAAIVLVGISLALGVLLVIPIGGADMPVVISLLNSYSGVAASATGFVLGNNLLIISGALVGAAGLILTKIMCVAMNRSLTNVVFGGFGAEPEAVAGPGSGYKNVRSASPEEASMVLEESRSVVFVPGYGMAVAQAQHAVRELASMLEQRGIVVKYAIHPVAGRMPGHMNVLLAEADVPYEQLVEMDDINPELRETDVAIVLGANDVVNPAAKDDKTSPIYGMPIIEVYEARTVFVLKRSLGAGFAGIKNDLFEKDNTLMVFGDAKKVLQSIIVELKSSAAQAA